MVRVKLFLGVVLAAMVTLCVVPVGSVHAQTRIIETITVGHPAGIGYGWVYPTGIAYDSCTDEIYVVNSWDCSVAIVDNNYTVIKKFS